MKKLKGIFPPIPTPFIDGEIAFDKLHENISKWNQTELAGYVVFGSNRESVFLTSKEKIDLIKKMAVFDSIIDLAARELKPHVLAIYARELADAFNQFYRFVPVIAAEDEKVRAARLALVDCARIVLANSLDTLGIAAPESM
jgi:arginyl-tRNA synthetase